MIADALPANMLSATHQPKGPGHKKRSKAMAQLLKQQELLMNDIENIETKASVRAQCTRAWKELQELRLRMMGKGPPKPVEGKTPKARSHAAVMLDTPAPVPKPTP